MAATTLTSGKNICKQVTFAIVAYGASSIAFTSSLFANPAIAVTLDVSSQYVQVIILIKVPSLMAGILLK